MNHQRKLIRHAIVAVLQAGDTLAGDNVLATAYKPRLRFPALIVLSPGEDQQLLASVGDIAARGVEHTLHLDVIAELQQNAGIEDTRDDLLGQVEALLANAAAAGELPGVTDLKPVAMRVDSSAEGEKPIEASRQRFEITYFTTQADPASAV